ncbi:sulfatase-like hydrolase/transferase [Dankookia sp. P2]|uniref:sulfatase-like hydrolase/transferase n=1 Tax=Dankookia sp. P2 TaxID=3423955 RepID=UPI003D66D62A
MERRDFLRSAGIAATGALAGAAEASARAPEPGPQPNILFILVDELRFPSVFPAGIDDVDGFLARFMPNLHGLWRKGVKFGSHYTAASACTPSRGVLVTGLYSQQSWVCVTLTNTPGSVSPTPILNPAFPTYGRLLRQAGYQTPYIGKWHLSFDMGKLDVYGFDGLVSPDPTGFNLQGTVGDEKNGYRNDQDIADTAVGWLAARRPDEQPWCCTVSFVNPHDQQFFWAGTESQTYNALFTDPALQPVIEYSTPDDPPLVSWDDNPLKTVPDLGFPALPPNWESAATLQANKPSTQLFGRTAQAAVWGDIAQDPAQTGFTAQPYPGVGGLGLGVAPYAYWQRALNSYANIMGIVDQRIGEVLAALPKAVAENTVIVFASDHGEYAGAHGYVAGKLLSCYEEAYHVPLIVVDPTHRFTGDIHAIRTGLTSSVDFTPMLVSLGHNGSSDWLRGRLGRIYAKRHDMLPMLKSAAAPGRPYVLLATDELLPARLNFNDAPTHIVGIRTDEAKLGTYAKWAELSTEILPGSMELEFYDYATAEGRAELASRPDDPRARALLRLLERLIPQELRERLPGGLGPVQDLQRDLYLLLAQKVLSPDGDTPARDAVRGLGYGRDSSPGGAAQRAVRRLPSGG